jgi:tRNA threonylcarbamoyladenosine biosynthesis protein TsaB
MSVILMIETSTRVCSVGISVEGEMQAMRESVKPNSHASLVSVFIEEVLKECNLRIVEIDAVAVSMGPGSYTGLRIGVSSAKGICYAATKPLIAVNTLKSIAAGMINVSENISQDSLFCPMIDARRMEVYMAIYDNCLNEISPVSAEIITSDFFEKFSPSKLFVSGDGSEKIKDVVKYIADIQYLNIEPSVRHMCKMANEAFEKAEFVDVAYFEPYYLKDFVAGKPVVKGLQ